MCLVGDIALNPSIRKSKRELSKHVLRYRIDSSCKLLLSIYTLIILTMRLSANELKNQRTKIKTRSKKAITTFLTLYIDGVAEGVKAHL